MKVLAFGASTSKKSINQRLAAYVASLVPQAEVDLLDLNDFEMPIYSADREEASGQPAQAGTFLKRIEAADAIIISFAEHNGIFSAAYKNVFDWASRINHKMFLGKPVLLLASSPGGRGGASVLAFATSSMPHFDADVRGSISVPNFYDNFDLEKGEITHLELRAELQAAANKLVE